MFNKIKKVIKFEKENMPDYQYKFNYYFLLPFAFMFIVGPIIALSITIPMGISNSEHYLIPVIIWGSIVFSMLIILIPYGRYVAKRVIGDEVANLNKIVKLTDLNTAINKLQEKNICNNIGFYTDDNDVIPFDELRYVFLAQYFGGKTLLSLVIHSQRYENNIFLDIDNNVYTLIKTQKFFIENVDVFSFFENNKRLFITKLMKRGSTINFKLGDLI